MGIILVIRVDMNDESDLDWIRGKCVAAVVNTVAEAQEENRLDSTSVEVLWDTEESEET